MAYYNKSPQNNGDGKNAEDRALDTFANMMIEKIESLGSKDGWQKPWFTEGTLSWPKNLSGREYKRHECLVAHHALREERLRVASVLHL